MKKIFLVFTLFLSQLGHADFFDAQKMYEEKKYVEAFNEYLELAKLGNQKAQFNIAIMLFNGIGTEKDIVKAFGWSELAAQSKNEKYIEQSKSLKNQLPADLVNSAENFAKSLTEKYSAEVLKLKLAPTEFASNDNDENQEIKVVPIKTIAPHYPRSALRKGVSGWVKLEFEVHPDGTVRNVNPYASLPEGVFVKAASESASEYQFEFQQNGKKIIPDSPRIIHQRIDFKLYGSNPSVIQKSIGKFEVHPMFNLSKVGALLDKAKSGHTAAQYTLAINYETLFSKSTPVEQNLINQWLLSAAQDGVVDAQYQIGKNIFYGKGCKVEKQKGLDWISTAAKFGHLGADYMVYNLLTSEKLVNSTEHDANAWLEQAAKNGSLIAQLKFAKHIAQLQHPKIHQLKLANEYIKSYSSKVDKNIDWAHTKALLEAKMGKSKSAKKLLKKTITRAKRLNWDTTELENDLKLI